MLQDVNICWEQFGQFDALNIGTIYMGRNGKANKNARQKMVQKDGGLCQMEPWRPKIDPNTELELGLF